MFREIEVFITQSLVSKYHFSLTGYRIPWKTADSVSGDKKVQGNPRTEEEVKDQRTHKNTKHGTQSIKYLGINPTKEVQDTTLLKEIKID